jgi:dipeptidyl aminopeptidase/acylaminoacyl peptidase
MEEGGVMMGFSRSLFQTVAALAITGAVSFSVNAIAEDEKAETPKYNLLDELMQVKYPNDVQISPDGKWVAYVVSRDDEKKDEGFSQIWMSSTDGKTTVPLTASYTNASRPRWNPDGTTIAFKGRRGDDKDAKSQVWLLDRRGGEAQQHTDVKQGVGSFEWSPDGSRMLLVIKDQKPEDIETEDEGGKKKKAKKKGPKPYVIDRLQFKQDYVGYLDRRRTHIFLFDGENDPVQITSGDYDDYSPTWSPDGTKIAFVSKREDDPDANNNSEIWVVEADAEADEHPLTQVTKNPGPDYSPSWSPDGKTIAFVTSVEPEKLWYDTEHLAIAASDGSGEARLLTEDYDRMVSSPKYSENGKSIYFRTADGGNRPIKKINVKSGKLETVTEGEVSVRTFSLGTKDRIAMTRSTHHSPFEVYWLNKKKETQLTDLNGKLLKDAKLARVERLNVPGWKGENVESFVYYPADHDPSKAYPTLFVLHGGPVSQHDTSFDGWAQLFAANGYIAVLPNPHGSSGYGEAFTYSLNRQWGVPDFADVDAIADHLVAEGIADGDKLGVGGWSYGGILTNYVITKSTRFKGAVSGASEVNHRANYGHDIYQHFWEVEMGLPWEDIEAWENMNPFNDLGKVTTPTLVIGGQVDWNVPIQNSEQLYQVLRRRGIETQLVVYPNEHHGISRPSFRRDRDERYLAWFDKYVRGIKPEPVQAE